MKLIYTNENRLLVGNAENILESHGIEVVWRNEFNQGAAGEVSPGDAWPELWLVDEADYDKASKILENSLTPEDAPDWKCDACGEDNGPSFEVCWNCGAAP